MLKMMECLNERCNADVGSFTGHHKNCPNCGSYNVSNFMWPENTEEALDLVKTGREEYNRKNMHKPDFVPSVAYDKNGDPIES